MRAVLAPLVVLALLGCSASAAGSSTTSLRVTYWEDASNPATRTIWTLRCNPARGSLPRPVRACRKLAVGGAKLFAAVPPDTVCTEIYGGPQQARVVGTVKGKPVRTTFTRTNGCQITRWQRISPWLVPPGGVTR